MVIFSESMHWHSSDSATARNGKLPLLHMFLFCLKGKKKSPPMEKKARIRNRTSAWRVEFQPPCMKLEKSAADHWQTASWARGRQLREKGEPASPIAAHDPSPLEASICQSESLPLSAFIFLGSLPSLN
jgi:hypothetical protein